MWWRPVPLYSHSMSEAGPRRMSRSVPCSEIVNSTSFNSSFNMTEKMASDNKMRSWPVPRSEHVSIGVSLTCTTIYASFTSWGSPHCEMRPPTPSSGLGRLLPRRLRRWPYNAWTHSPLTVTRSGPCTELCSTATAPSPLVCWRWPRLTTSYSGRVSGTLDGCSFATVSAASSPDSGVGVIRCWTASRSDSFVSTMSCPTFSRAWWMSWSPVMGFRNWSRRRCMRCCATWMRWPHGMHCFVCTWVPFAALYLWRTFITSATHYTTWASPDLPRIR